MNLVDLETISGSWKQSDDRMRARIEKLEAEREIFREYVRVRRMVGAVGLGDTTRKILAEAEASITPEMMGEES
jgi:hypothetical protein